MDAAAYEAWKAQLAAARSVDELKAWESVTHPHLLTPEQMAEIEPLWRERTQAIHDDKVAKSKARHSDLPPRVIDGHVRPRVSRPDEAPQLPAPRADDQELSELPPMADPEE